MKEEALGRTVQSTRFGREYGLSSDKLRDDDNAFKIFGTGMRKIYAEITKKIEKKKYGENLCVLVVLLSQVTIFYNAVNSDRSLVTLTKKTSCYCSTKVYTMLCAV